MGVAANITTVLALGAIRWYVLENQPCASRSYRWGYFVTHQRRDSFISIRLPDEGTYGRPEKGNRDASDSR